MSGTHKADGRAGNSLNRKLTAEAGNSELELGNDSSAAAHGGIGDGLNPPENAPETEVQSTETEVQNTEQKVQNTEQKVQNTESEAKSGIKPDPAESKEVYDKCEKTLEVFNNLKSKEFFDPDKHKEAIHVIGCGAVGGAICELLARLGVKEIHIWDFDTVSPHNMSNQIFRNKDIGHYKVDAISSILHDINPNMDVEKHNCPITKEDRISGYVFLCLDNIDVRRELCKKWKLNPYIKCVTDGRMRLTDGNVHFADWSQPKEQNSLILSMNYTHEEAVAETPVSACGLTLSVVCTPRTVSNLMVANWIKFLNDPGKQKKLIMVDAYVSSVDSF